jgi:hypothetical protein
MYRLKTPQHYASLPVQRFSRLAFPLPYLMSGPQDLGVEPPFSAVYPDDQAGSLWIVTILATIYVLLSALVRGFIKWGIYGADDYLLAVATVCRELLSTCTGLQLTFLLPKLIFFAQSTAILYGLSHGLSKFNSITTESEWEASGRSFLASEVLAILALCLAKCSVVLLMHRVFSSNTGWRVWLRMATLCLSVAWGIAGVIVIATSCNADTILTSRSVTECPGQVSNPNTAWINGT